MSISGPITASFAMILRQHGKGDKTLKVLTVTVIKEAIMTESLLSGQDLCVPVQQNTLLFHVKGSATLCSKV